LKNWKYYKGTRVFKSTWRFTVWP